MLGKKPGGGAALTNLVAKKPAPGPAGITNLFGKKGAGMDKKVSGGFGNLMDKKAKGFGAFGKRGAAPAADTDGHGLLEGISSLHSWIKSQTMIRPNQKVNGKPGGAYEEVS